MRFAELTVGIAVALFCPYALAHVPNGQHPLAEHDATTDRATPSHRYDQTNSPSEDRRRVRTPKDNGQHLLPDPSVHNYTLLPYTFQPLALGSIKPLGWFRQQLELMSNGLPGQIHTFYRLVKDAPWVGGDQEYSPLNEAFPYWLNGLVPLAYSLHDERLKSQVLKYVGHIIDSQHDDGWLGPESDLQTRNFWGRYPLFLAFTQIAEAEVGTPIADRIISSMHRFVELMHSMLLNSHEGYVWKDGDKFDEQWGRSRSADMILSLQWLYEHHPRNNSRVIYESMSIFHEMSYDWSQHFTEDQYVFEDLDTLPSDLTDRLFPFVHGVNVGQGLKYPAVVRRLIHDPLLTNISLNGVNWTFTYHGTPSGAIIGDERLAGLSPVRGTELCSVVETMFSLSYLYHAIGDRYYADRAELAAFNALPTMVMPRWWAHQYVAQTNQPVSRRLHTSPNHPFWNVRDHGQTFGLEPNYPCCTVDFSQGYPKFLSASFVRNGNGLAHALLIPAEVKTTLPHSNKVEVLAETNYPFSNSILYTIESQHSFPFSFRVPSWANLSSSTYTLNNSPPLPLHPNTTTGMHTIPLDPGITTLQVTFSTTLQIHPRSNSTISISHGALVYAVSPPSTSHASRPANYPGQEAPPEAHDWTLLPRPDTPPWNIAIDPSTLFHYNYPLHPPGTAMPNPVWSEDAWTELAGVSVLACRIDWNLTEGGWADEVPGVGGERSEPSGGRTGGGGGGGRRCLSRAFPVELKPLGTAKLHVVEIPTVDLSRGSEDLGGDGDVEV